MRGVARRRDADRVERRRGGGDRPRVRPGAGLIAGSVTASVELVDERTVARLNGGGIAVAPAGGETRSLAESLAAAFRAAHLRSTSSTMPGR
jgi:hypothetical protein